MFQSLPDLVESILNLLIKACADKIVFLDMDIKHGKTPNLPEDTETPKAQTAVMDHSSALLTLQFKNSLPLL